MLPLFPTLILNACTGIYWSKGLSIIHISKSSIDYITNVTNFFLIKNILILCYLWRHRSSWFILKVRPISKTCRFILRSGSTNLVFRSFLPTSSSVSSNIFCLHWLGVKLINPFNKKSGVFFCRIEAMPPSYLIAFKIIFASWWPRLRSPSSPSLKIGPIPSRKKCKVWIFIKSKKA